MANVIVGNTYIIDTQSDNNVIPWLRDSKVQAISFWSGDSTGNFQISGTNTSQILRRLSNPLNVPNTVGVYLGGVNFTDVLKIPILVNGTAWIDFV